MATVSSILNISAATLRANSVDRTLDASAPVASSSHAAGEPGSSVSRWVDFFASLPKAPDDKPRSEYLAHLTLPKAVIPLDTDDD